MRDEGLQLGVGKATPQRLGLVKAFVSLAGLLLWKAEAEAEAGSVSDSVVSSYLLCVPDLVFCGCQE